MDESEYCPASAQGLVDETGWQIAMNLIRAAQSQMRDRYGVGLHLHPHVGTCIETEAQIDRLLSETEVWLCFDTGHHAFWHQDVPSFMSRVWDRIGFIHLKNVNPAVRARVLSGALGVNAAFDHGAMCPLSEGAVGILAVMHRLLVKGFTGPVIVEQDPSKDADRSPEALARANLTYLQSAVA